MTRIKVRGKQTKQTFIVGKRLLVTCKIENLWSRNNS